MPVPGKYSVIVSNTARKPERAFASALSLLMMVELVSIAYFRKASNRHLGGQPKRFTDWRVAQPLECKLPESGLAPCYIAYPVARSVGLPHGPFESKRLIRAWEEFELSNQLHGVSIVQMFNCGN